jgi:hypothetical protein
MTSDRRAIEEPALPGDHGEQRVHDAWIEVRAGARPQFGRRLRSRACLPVRAVVVIALHASHAQTIRAASGICSPVDDVFVDPCIGRIG